jgi:hypothetical protein
MCRLLMIFLAVTSSVIIAGCDDGQGEEPHDAAPDSDAVAAECERDEDCDDGLECTSEYCESGRCRRDTDDQLCDDGDPCNGTETCQIHRGCEPGEPILCDDRINCTVDSCNPETGRCVSVPEDSRCPNGHLCDPSLDGCVPRG